MAKSTGMGMRDSLVVFSQNGHAFLASDIPVAANVFKRVYLICPKHSAVETSLSGINNLKIIGFSKREMLCLCFLHLPDVFSAEKRMELKAAITSHALSKEYLKSFFQYLAFEHLLFSKVKKIGFRQDNASKWVLLSAWYAGTANAVSKIKARYSDIKAVSLVHSFEVDPLKNKFTNLLYRSSYHGRLDVVSFISYKVYQQFNETLARDMSLSLANCSVAHLGTKKRCAAYSPASSDGKLRILSCSDIVPVKRVELILESLDKATDTNIIWTHVGNGPLKTELEKKIKYKCNPRLQVVLLDRFGSIDKWHDYFVNNEIDLFINVSISEGLPATILEALAYGIPVVATDAGGSAEALEPAYSMLLPTDATPDTVSAAIKSFINSTEKEKHHMRKAAVSRFQKDFDVDTIRPQFYSHLSNNNGPIM